MSPVRLQKSEFLSRKEKTLKLIEEQILVGLLAFSSFQEREGHVAYLCNHHNSFPNGMSHSGLGHAAYFLAASGEGTLIAPLGYQAGNVHNVDRGITDGNLVNGILKALRAHNLADGAIGIAGMDVIPAEIYLRLIKEAADQAFINADQLLEGQRVIKSANEVELLREAARIAAVGLRAGIETAKPGVTQHEVETAARRAALQAGADFIPRVRVASGNMINTLTWPMTSNQVLQAGNFVFIDLIGWANGYGFDNSRVIVTSKATSEQKAFLDHMASATQWMIEVMRANKEMEFVATESRTRMITPMAHGIGLEICENPWINRSQRFTLKPGMVLCVEPILSAPEFGGMCIEDTVALTESGVELLTDLPRTFWD